MATMAAAFSGFVFLGGPGLTYEIGLAAFAIIIPIGFTSGLLCWNLAAKLRSLAGKGEVYTIPDAIASRFASPIATFVSILAVLIGTVGYLGAQFLALAVLLEVVLDGRSWFGAWSFPLALALGMTVVLLYSLLGGMVAGAYTDVLQGTVMLVTAVLVFGRAVQVSGGWNTMLSSLGSSPDFEGFFAPLRPGLAPTTMGFFLVFGIGVLGQPHMLHKFYMLDDPRRLRWMPLVLGGSQALCLLTWIGLGLAVPSLVAQGVMAPLSSPDSAAPRFLMEIGPPAVAGLVVAAVLAAIMSTADSFLNIGAAALVHDLPRLFRRRPGRLAAARWATVGVALLAAALSLAYGDLIALLGTFAFGTLGAALAPVFAVGMHWQRVTGPVAAASMLTGLVSSLALELFRRWSPSGSLVELGLPAGTVPAAVALTASLTVLLAFGWLSGQHGDRGAQA